MPVRAHSKTAIAYVLFAAAVLTLITACRLVTGETGTSAPTDTAPVSPPYFATPAAQSPASGICGGFDGEVIPITIRPDIPDPRCVEVRPDQKLRVINGTAGVLHVVIGLFEVDIEPNGEHTFDVPFGEYLLPGVHVFQVSPCCSPELVYKPDSP
jgi:hypothetical protein